MKSFFPGKETVVESTSRGGRWKAVFEDDGETGYFYALDLDEQKMGRNPIQEAVHIYNVKSVADRIKESVASIVWSADGERTCLLINNYPHAVFDFVAERAYCRTNFPPPGKWKSHDFEWDESVLSYFR